MTDVKAPPPAARLAVTEEEALHFIDSAGRNWRPEMSLTRDDLEDLRAELEDFINARAKLLRDSPIEGAR